MRASRRVLLFGHDDMLLHTRSLILEGAGFQVWTAQNLGHAAETMVIQQIDALILCQTLSADERSKAIVMGEALCPEMKVLVLEDEYARAPRRKAVAALDTITSPVTFIAAVRRMTVDAEATPAQE